MKTIGTSGRQALTLVEVLVIIAVILILGRLLMPRLAGGGPSKRIACVNNLKQVGLASHLWAYDNAGKFPMQVSVTNGGTMEFVASGRVSPHFRVMSNLLNTPRVLVCPVDKRRPATSWESFSDSDVSYFVGLDADKAQSQLLLSGDSDLEVAGKPVGRGILNLWTNSLVGWTAARHVHQGNVALADSSVQQLDSARLRTALANTGSATNRLAIP